MLAAAVYAAEGLFVQQAHKPVLTRHLFHYFHCKLIVIRRDVCCGVHGRQFMLSGSHLIVLGFCKYAQLPKLIVKILHEGLYAAFNNTEIMVVHLLTLWGHSAEKRAAGIYKVLAFVIILFIHKKVFLLCAYGGEHRGHIAVAEKRKHAQSLLVYGLHGAQQRGFFIQCLSSVGAEGRGYAKGVVLYKGIGGGIPRSIAAGFERGAQPAGGEAGRIGLALYKLLAGEFQYNRAAVVYRSDEAVMLFGGYACHRLKPMCIVCSALLHGPVLHGRGHRVCHAAFKGLIVLYVCLKSFVYFLGKLFPHYLVVEYHAAEYFGGVAHLFLLPGR